MVKCSCCNKKLPLAQELVGRCKCDKVFCSHHRAPEQHGCAFDFQSAAKRLLQETNPKVEAKKVEVI